MSCLQSLCSHALVFEHSKVHILMQLACLLFAILVLHAQQHLSESLHRATHVSSLPFT